MHSSIILTALLQDMSSHPLSDTDKGMLMSVIQCVLCNTRVCLFFWGKIYLSAYLSISWTGYNDMKEMPAQMVQTPWLQLQGSFLL